MSSEVAPPLSELPETYALFLQSISTSLSVATVIFSYVVGFGTANSQSPEFASPVATQPLSNEKSS